ncbi:MAG: AraC family transcriptional regulator [Clostridiales bacterium]|nr:AraC family transcriptional regulator [Clostridiales bacterium]
MKSLDEYIEEVKAHCQEEELLRYKMIREEGLRRECEKNGFWVVGGNRKSHALDRIGVSYHGLPDDFSKLGYMHRHDHFEMMYVYRGSCFNKMPEYTIHLHEGDIVLLNPNVLHCPHVEHEDDVLLNFWISNDLVQRNIIPMLRDNQLFTTFFVDFLYRSPDAKRFLYFHENSSAIRQLCEMMCLEGFQKQKFCASVLESSLTTLFALLARDYQSDYGVASGSTKDGLIYEILTYIEQNCADVTLETLAQRFQYAPSYLSRLIKKHTGKSFSEIVHAQRMSLVLQYLGSTGLPVIDIANLAGFSDIMYFNRVFKAKFGQTPTEYRKGIQTR